MATDNVVSVSRKIPAPPEQVFALLADPAAHPVIDGSGMLREPVGPKPITAIGQAFAMHMHNDDMGDYEMTNHIIAFEPNRRIGWEPVMTAASKEEFASTIGNGARQVWSFELAPDGPDSTVVTETFDCSRSPEWLQTVVKGGERWLEAMTVTLERLEAKCAGSA